MKEFFKSKGFKVLLAVLVVLLAFMIRAASSGGLATITSSFLGAIVEPFQKVTSSISAGVSGFFGNILHAGDLADENQQLKEELAQMREQLVDFETYRLENEELKKFLNIKEENPDMDLEPALVIGRSPSDRFYSFTIDKGSQSGIALRDPVITSEGLVGVVTSLSTTSATVTTILDPALNVGAITVQSQDVGTVSGNGDLVGDGYCGMSHLSRSSQAKEGDMVQTSGLGGLFPKGLLIGEIVSISPEDQGTTLYATIRPYVDVTSVRNVMVIKSFNGQQELQE